MASAAFAFLALPSFAVVSTTGNTTALDTTYSFVGSFSDRATGTSLYGSGVVVGPNQILTARHVSNSVSFGIERFTLGNDVFTPISVSTPPNYTLPDGTTTAVDLALVTVAETFSDYYQIASSTSVGSTITMVGYGIEGGVSSDGLGYFTRAATGRRAGDNTLDQINEPVGGIGPTLISYLDRAGEAVLADKDSGGGWFQNGQLVGISSFVYNETDPANDPEKYRGYGFAALNTAGYNSAIDSPSYTGTPYTIAPGNPYFLSGAVDLTNPQVNSWLRANVVPEPTSMIALGLGVAAFVRRRKKA